MRKCLMIVSLLSLSVVSALAQSAPEFFKLQYSTVRGGMTVPGTCQEVVDLIAGFAPALGGTKVPGTLGSVQITFPNDKSTIILRTQPQQAQCTATLTCENPQGGGAEALCQQIEGMIQDLQRESLSQC